MSALGTCNVRSIFPLMQNRYMNNSILIYNRIYNFVLHVRVLEAQATSLSSTCTYIFNAD